jgi:hypothetical protein
MTRALRRLNSRVSIAFAAVALALLGAAQVNAAQSLKIAVYGGTGRIGQRIVNEALSRGHEVTVIVRDATAEKDTRPRLHVIQGNIVDTDSVATEIAGQDVVISAVGGGRSQGADFYTRAAVSLVSAERRLGAKAPHLLLVIGGAGSLQTSSGKLLLDSMSNMGRDSDPFTQKAALDYFRTVGDVPWSFVSPSMQIFPGTRTGKFRVGGEQLLTDASGKSSISMEDFAAALIDEAEHPQHIHKHFTVGY